MIVFSDKTVAVFFCVVHVGVDWMAHIHETKPDEEYELVYRFRYDAGDGKNPFEGTDRKNWYSGTISATRAYTLSATRVLAKMISERGPSPHKYYELENYNDIKAFMTKLYDAPFMYVRRQV